MHENISSLAIAKKIAQTCASALKKPYWVLRSPASKDDTPSTVQFVVISFEELSTDENAVKFAKHVVEEKIS